MTNAQCCDAPVTIVEKNQIKLFYAYLFLFGLFAFFLDTTVKDRKGSDLKMMVTFTHSENTYRFLTLKQYTIIVG